MLHIVQIYLAIIAHVGVVEPYDSSRFLHRADLYNRRSIKLICIAQDLINCKITARVARRHRICDAYRSVIRYETVCITPILLGAINMQLLQLDLYRVESPDSIRIAYRDLKELISVFQLSSYLNVLTSINRRIDNINTRASLTFGYILQRPS